MLASIFSNVLTTSISMSVILVPLLLASSKLNKLFIIKWKYCCGWWLLLGC